MSLSRRSFVATAAASAAAIAAPVLAADAPTPERAPVHFHILKSSEYDYAGMMHAITAAAPSKQLYQASAANVPAPGIASIYLHMQNAMNAFQFSMPQEQRLATIGVLMAPAMVFALDDAMWKKYGIGSALNLPAQNLYYEASSKLDPKASPDDPNGMYQDWSARAVMARGAKLFVCHNATTAVAAMMAAKNGTTPAAVLHDFEQHLLPGFSFVASGVGTVQLATMHGWSLFQV